MTPQPESRPAPISGIDVVEQNDDGRRYFVLEHPFDLSLLDLEHIERPFSDLSEAEKAADILLAAVTGTDD